MAQDGKTGTHWINTADTDATGAGGEAIAPGDIDDLVKNFPGDSSAEKIPAVFGRGETAPTLGRISQVKRDGNALMGKVADADPRFDKLHEAGKLPKRAVSVTRSPDGLALTRVRFIAPTYVNGQRGEMPGTEDALDNLVAGHDTDGFNTSFRDLSQYPSLSVAFEEQSSHRPGRGAQSMYADSNSEKLNDLARKRQREQKVSFGEALTAEARLHPELVVVPVNVAGSGELRFETNSERLCDLAKKRAREVNISFGEALTQVADEHPELTVPGNPI